jgi:hypothetical protein
MNVYFSDYFHIDPELIEKYGAVNISIINDLPLFVDPFLLFESEKEEYRNLHKKILEYVAFLRDSSVDTANEGLLRSWFCFAEVKQNWLGYCENGNEGNGLGIEFAKALNRNLDTVFSSFGEENITKDSHLEKLCIVKDGVGRDNISDFTVNLIKEFLCEYTQQFAVNYINPKFVKEISVPKVIFDKNTLRWKSKKYNLPFFEDDFVLLTPRDILTKDDTWINNSDLYERFYDIASSVPNEELRYNINRYFQEHLPKKPDNKEPSKKEEKFAKHLTILEFPELLDYYIKLKEDTGTEAKHLSKEQVDLIQSMFIDGPKKLFHSLCKNSKFYELEKDTYSESLARVKYLKQVIEKNDAYKLFYHKEVPIKKEKDLQLLFRLTWYASISDVNSEVNNGRGAVDYKISRGSADKTLVEFKLASNNKLKQNLANQVGIYEQANETDKSIKVILYYTAGELERVNRILAELGLSGIENVILIDARNDNKISASLVKK